MGAPDQDCLGELPLTVEGFSARCDALKVRDQFAIAVSGGRDSMALACLAAAYAKKTGARILALTVDHGLRDGSDKEAALVQSWCEGLDLEHQILTWRGIKPVTGIQAAARTARYKLLVEACNETGIEKLMTAHSADDQAETVMMRLSRGAGGSGLRGMEEEILFAAGAGAPVSLLRPLLDASRACLTATVKVFRQPFVDDPSNEDHAYERVRARALLADMEGRGALTRQVLLQVASEAKKTHDLLQIQYAETFQQLAGCFYQWGGAALDQKLIDRVSRDAFAATARRLIYAVGGGEHMPEEGAAISALESVMKTGAGTAGGSLLRLSDGRVWFLREPAALLGRAGVAPIKERPVAAGSKILWDNRFIIKTGPDCADTIVKPVGAVEAPKAMLGGLFNGPKEALAAIPGIFRGGRLIAAPGHLSGEAEGCSFRALQTERFKGGIVRFS